MSSHAFSDEELDAFEAKCDAATPGEWFATDGSQWTDDDRLWLIHNGDSSPEGAFAQVVDGEWGDRAEHTARFIAAASPDTVKALVATVRELRGALRAFADLAAIFDHRAGDMPDINVGVVPLSALRRARQVLGDVQVGQGDA